MSSSSKQCVSLSAGLSSHGVVPNSPGSRIWKVGFSGEPRPRKVFWATNPDGTGLEEGEMWGLDLEAMADQMNLEQAFATDAGSSSMESPIKYEEVLRVIKARLTTALRKVYSQ